MRRVLDSRTIAAWLFLAVLVPSAAGAESTPILAVVPEGAVIDATAFSDLAVGGTFSLRSSQDNGKELARGSVVDLRDGRALIGVSAGGAVKAGDVALRCATPASQTQLKASLEQIKAQVAAAPTPELQQILADLDTAVQSRDTAIASGTCDVSTLDQKLNDLGARLQQAMAVSSTATTAATPSSPDTATQGANPASTGTTTGQPDTKAGGEGAGTAGADSLDSIVQVVGKLFKMFQSLGSGSGDGSSRGNSDAGVPASGAASSDASTATPPPSQTPAPFAPTPAPVDAPSAPTPPSTGTIGTVPVTPPAPVAPVAPVTPPARPPRIVVSPTPAVPARPPVGAPPSSPPATPAQPGGTSPTPPWWTVVRPRPTPTTGADSGTAAGGVQLKPLPTIGGSAPPSGPLRPVGPIAAVKPGVVHGRVVGDVDGRPGFEPVRGASVSISDARGTADRRAVTNDAGAFTFAGLAAGRYSVVVTAPGFRPATVGVSLAGDDVPLNLTLQRQVAPPALRPRTVPNRGLPPTHTRPESP